MNFYNNKLGASKYFKILGGYKYNFTREFLVQNSGSFFGDRSLYKLLVCFELLKKIKNVKGDIIELGVWNGNNLLTIKKIIDYLKINKKIFGYDHFKGMPKSAGDFQRNNFKGDKKLVQYFIKFFNLKNIILINDDILDIKKYLNSFKKFSFIYVDCDLYDTTKTILDLLSPRLSKGGLIVFDEGNQKKNSGETLALQRFYKKNKKYYKRILLKSGYQPDIYFKKIK